MAVIEIRCSEFNVPYNLDVTHYFHKPTSTARCPQALKPKPRKCPVKPLNVVRETHVEHGDQRSLQQTHQHVAPVVLVIRDPGVAHVHGEGHQEELDGRPQKSGPFSNQSGLHIKLESGKRREAGKEVMGWMERDGKGRKWRKSGRNSILEPKLEKFLKRYTRLCTANSVSLHIAR